MGSGQSGIQGLKGDTGPLGPKGDKGDQGLKGDTGPLGPKGDSGPKGDIGPSGGPKGDTGPQGIKGDQGLVGAKGDTGLQGVKGDQGLVGAKGDTGPSAYSNQFDLSLGSFDKTRGDTGPSRALVKDNGGILTVNYGNDFKGVNLNGPLNINGDTTHNGKTITSGAGLTTNDPSWLRINQDNVAKTGTAIYSNAFVEKGLMVGSFSAPAPSGMMCINGSYCICKNPNNNNIGICKLDGGYIRDF